MTTVTVQQMRQDPDAVAELARHGPVAVVHEGRTVALLGIDSAPPFEIEQTRLLTTSTQITVSRTAKPRRHYSPLQLVVTGATD